jgi:hypothetical protein
LTVGRVTCFSLWSALKDSRGVFLHEGLLR